MIHFTQFKQNFRFHIVAVTGGALGEHHILWQFQALVAGNA
jgi:hypothetical protein